MRRSQREVSEEGRKRKITCERRERERLSGGGGWIVPSPQPLSSTGGGEGGGGGGGGGGEGGMVGVKRHYEGVIDCCRCDTKLALGGEEREGNGDTFFLYCIVGTNCGGGWER